MTTSGEMTEISGKGRPVEGRRAAIASPTLPIVAHAEQQSPPAAPCARESRPPRHRIAGAEADRIRAPNPLRRPRDHTAAAPDLLRTGESHAARRHPDRRSP